MTHTSSAKIHDAENLLSDVLGNQLAEIIDMVSADPGSAKSYIIDIPEADSIDSTVENMRSLVARTSNHYGRVTRFAAMARAQMKIAEGRYRRKYKASLVGANKEDREANATRASTDEAIELDIIEAVVELAQGAELHTRIASESSRKLLNSMENMYTAGSREEKGSLRQSDFNDFF